MTVKEIQAIAKKLGIQYSRQKKAELIHTIQMAEGNINCFGTGNDINCGEESCLWREDCMPKAK